MSDEVRIEPGSGGSGDAAMTGIVTYPSRFRPCRPGAKRLFAARGAAFEEIDAGLLFGGASP